MTWCRAVREHGFLPDNPRDICTLTVLVEGIGHKLPGALGTVLAPNHARGDHWIGVSRFGLPKNRDDVSTPFDATLRRALEAAFRAAPLTHAHATLYRRSLPEIWRARPSPVRILLGTPAGSAVGARKIAELCAREGVELILFFFGAVFGLWQDGTALPWCYPDRVLAGTSRSMANRTCAARLFNNIEGFCAVGDCSANFFDVEEAEKILKEEEERLLCFWNPIQPLDASSGSLAQTRPFESTQNR